MAKVEKNLAVWNETWDWSLAGEEWSSWWGGTPALWHGALLPRVHAFVPTGTILEIAPGYGRWTQFLKDLAQQLVIVDLAERCIEQCRQRFADADNIEYHVNDGRTLPVPDRSVDLVFSFDSLVHVEADVIDDYLRELARVLKPDGIAFIHHSNAGRHKRRTAIAKRTPERVRRPLVAHGAMVDVYAWRAESVTADSFAESAGRAGLACVGQELITWESGPYLTDALSLVAPRGSRWERPRQLTRNLLFREEAKRMARLYAGTSFPGNDRKA